jgi:hypothetical protein
MLKHHIKTLFNLSNNQVNLLLLSTATSIFQGIVFFGIERKKFSIQYFLLTVVMCFIYYVFYYKTYVHDKK